ncbi:LysR substrate-binding domain-containing protein [Iodobacter sp. BJB302]|uniref:LysR substrate-binding domain-containing protein n=1 Tax=Iodobacter sp. BJB302 TaxID=1506510 RepID=UPI0027B87F60|nr:LysR substrate-binding domain-containing protein [Iodobacter sp. BJB302]
MLKYCQSRTSTLAQLNRNRWPFLSAGWLPLLGTRCQLHQRLQLVPRMAAFQAAHPEIDLHIHASNQAVDLHSGAVDLAIRYGKGNYHDLLATQLLQDHFAPVASKQLHIRQLSDLSLHPLIHFNWHSPPPEHLTWAGWLQNAGISDLDSTAGIRYSEESHAIQAALAGQGVALLSLELVREEIAMGLLEAPLTPVVEGLAYHLVRPALKPAAAAVTLVEKWLIQAASTHPKEYSAPPVSG